MVFQSKSCTLTARRIALALFFVGGIVGTTAGQSTPGGAAQHGAGRKRRLAPPKVDLSGYYHEDLSELTLDGSRLQVRPPLQPEIERHEQFIRERHSVQWRGGDPFDLYILRPVGVEKAPVIIYLGSFPSETRRFKDDAFCARLTQSGFAAVGFVSALTGDRYQNRPMKQWFVSQLRESLVETTHDVQMILNLLAARSEFDMTRVGMFGYGSGATIAILAAAADPRIKVIDLVDPWGGWPDWMAKSPVVPEEERAGFLKPEFLDDVASLDPVVWLPKLKREHLRLQLVKSDVAVPAASVAQIESATPGTAVVARFANPEEQAAAMGNGKLFQWLKDQLQPEPQKSAAEKAGRAN